MPRKLEKLLRRQAKQRGYGKDRTNRYVYGKINSLKKAKGKQRHRHTEE